MAPLPANDQNMWIPPTPIGVQQEAGFQPQLIGTAAGEWSPNYLQGWCSQTYLNITGVNITQTYDLEAPAEEKPKRTRTKVEK